MKTCVVSIGFNRKEKLAKSVLSVLKHYGPRDSYDYHLYIDKAKDNSKHTEKNNDVIKFSKKIYLDGLVDKLVIRNINYGCANNIYSAVTQTLMEYDQAFIVEDDVILGRFHYGLAKLMFDNYHRYENIGSFSTYSHDIGKTDKSTYLTFRHSSHAWGTWSDKGSGFDLNIVNNINIKSSNKSDINKKLGSDIYRNLKACLCGAIDSWAIPWNFFNYINNRLSVNTTVAYAIVEGHDNLATHTRNIQFKYQVADSFIDKDKFASKLTKSNSKNIGYHSYFNRVVRRLKSNISQII